MQDMLQILVPRRWLGWLCFTQPRSLGRRLWLYQTIGGSAEAVPASKEHIIREAHRFLEEQACINFGAVQAATTDATALSDDDITVALLHLLETVDLEVCLLKACL